LTVRAVAAGVPVVVASSDKDFMQLVSDKVKLLVPHDKSESLWDEAQIRQKTGVEPAQIVDWLSLIGDSSDNIPGVGGVGGKTAAELLRKFASIDGIYGRLSEVKPEGLQARLQAAEAAVRRNQRLIRLKEDVADELRLEDLAAQPVDAEKLRRLFAGWGFKRLLQELEESDLAKTEDLFDERAQAS
jgi:DNA polymerase-1